MRAETKAAELLRPTLECGEFSPLSAGDLSPSNAKTAAYVLLRAAKRGSALATSRQSAEGGDKSPHSKVNQAGVSPRPARQSPIANCQLPIANRQSYVV